MPELPEVERVRLSLMDRIVGQTIEKVEIRRADVVCMGDVGRVGADERSGKPRRSKATLRLGLLESQTIKTIERHGKQLTIIGQQAGQQSDQPCFCVHLGMSGSLIHRPADQQANAPHSHLIWHLSGGGRLVFRDPRRFGGVWAFPAFADLKVTRWARLGLDALTIQPRQLQASLSTTTRGLKAALLDQTLIAGLGNIYVDELLFKCRLHPAQPANQLDVLSIQPLVHKMRKLLLKAIASGGSSLRDYVDGDGRPGDFQFSHLVYGRSGEPCSACSTPLVSSQVAGRTTVFCSRCQVLSD